MGIYGEPAGCFDTRDNADCEFSKQKPMRAVAGGAEPGVEAEPGARDAPQGRAVVAGAGAGVAALRGPRSPLSHTGRSACFPRAAPQAVVSHRAGRFRLCSFATVFKLEPTRLIVVAIKVAKGLHVQPGCVAMLL